MFSRHRESSGLEPPLSNLGDQPGLHSASNFAARSRLNPGRCQDLFWVKAKIFAPGSLARPETPARLMKETPKVMLSPSSITLSETKGPRPGRDGLRVNSSKHPALQLNQQLRFFSRCGGTAMTGSEPFSPACCGRLPNVLAVTVCGVPTCRGAPAALEHARPENIPAHASGASRLRLPRLHTRLVGRANERGSADLISRSAVFSRVPAQ